MFTNLTAHAYNRYEDSELTLTVEPSGFVARIINERVTVGDTLGVTTVKLFPKSVELIRREDMLARTVAPTTYPFPSEEDGTFFIVSDQVANALPDRTDLRVPDTDAAVLGTKGQIIGVPGFITK